MTNTEIQTIVINAVRYVGEDQENPTLIEATESSRLMGELDSMGIVFLLAELEERLSDQLEVEVALADERAMSQKTSPFRSVRTLTKYVEKLIEEET